MKYRVKKMAAKGSAGRSAPILRTFARKFSNVDFFLRLLPLKVDELVMLEM